MAQSVRDMLERVMTRKGRRVTLPLSVYRGDHDANEINDLAYDIAAEQLEVPRGVSLEISRDGDKLIYAAPENPLISLSEKWH